MATFTIPKMIYDDSRTDPFRQYFLFGISVTDFVGTIIIALVIGFLLGLKSIAAFIVVFAILIVLGIIMHLWFGVDTMLGYYIGLNPKPQRPIPYLRTI